MGSSWGSLKSRWDEESLIWEKINESRKRTLSQTQVQYLHWGFTVVSVMAQHKSTCPVSGSASSLLFQEGAWRPCALCLQSPTNVCLTKCDMGLFEELWRAKAFSPVNVSTRATVRPSVFWMPCVSALKFALKITLPLQTCCQSKCQMQVNCERDNWFALKREERMLRTAG